MNRRAIVIVAVILLLLGGGAFLVADPGFGWRDQPGRGYGFRQTQGQGGYGCGFGGPGSRGPGMMGFSGRRGYQDGYRDAYQGQRLEGADAEAAVEGYLGSSNEFEIVEIMEFEDNFYAQVAERGTENLAFEVLVDPYTGAVYPEMGPNMMWNTEYGHMGGIRRGFVPGAPSVGAPEARRIAQNYLDSFGDNRRADERVDGFPGYYTIHVLENGEITGMLSVNAVDGSVWYHDWHGRFLGMVLDHGHNE